MCCISYYSHSICGCGHERSTIASDSSNTLDCFHHHQILLSAAAAGSSASLEARVVVVMAPMSNLAALSASFVSQRLRGGDWYRCRFDDG